MNRIWDCLDTLTRINLAAQFKLKCFWVKVMGPDGEVDELELEGPISLEESQTEIDKIMRQAPKGK